MLAMRALHQSVCVELPVLVAKALAQIAKIGGLRFRSELPAVLASGEPRGRVGANAGAFLPNDFVRSSGNVCFATAFQLMRRNLP